MTLEELVKKHDGRPCHRPDGTVIPELWEFMNCKAAGRWEEEALELGFNVWASLSHGGVTGPDPV